MYWRLTPSTYPKVHTKAPDRLPGPSPLGWFNAL
jgi:hypothetical protein